MSAASFISSEQLSALQNTHLWAQLSQCAPPVSFSAPSFAEQGANSLPSAFSNLGADVSEPHVPSFSVAARMNPLLGITLAKFHLSQSQSVVVFLEECERRDLAYYSSLRTACEVICAVRVSFRDDKSLSFPLDIGVQPLVRNGLVYGFLLSKFSQLALLVRLRETMCMDLDLTKPVVDVASVTLLLVGSMQEASASLLRRRQSSAGGGSIQTQTRFRLIFNPASLPLFESIVAFLTESSGSTPGLRVSVLLDVFHDLPAVVPTNGAGVPMNAPGLLSVFTAEMIFSDASEGLSGSVSMTSAAVALLGDMPCFVSGGSFLNPSLAYGGAVAAPLSMSPSVASDASLAAFSQASSMLTAKSSEQLQMDFEAMASLGPYSAPGSRRGSGSDCRAFPLRSVKSASIFSSPSSAMAMTAGPMGSVGGAADYSVFAGPRRRSSLLSSSSGTSSQSSCLHSPGMNMGLNSILEDPATQLSNSMSARLAGSQPVPMGNDAFGPLAVHALTQATVAHLAQAQGNSVSPFSAAALNGVDVAALCGLGSAFPLPAKQQTGLGLVAVANGLMSKRTSDLASSVTNDINTSSAKAASTSGTAAPSGPTGQVKRKADYVVITDGTVVKNAAGAIAKVLGRLPGPRPFCPVYTESGSSKNPANRSVVCTAVKTITVARDYIKQEGNGFEVGFQPYPYLRRRGSKGAAASTDADMSSPAVKRDSDGSLGGPFTSPLMGAAALAGLAHSPQALADLLKPFDEGLEGALHEGANTEFAFRVFKIPDLGGEESLANQVPLKITSKSQGSVVAGVLVKLIVEQGSALMASAGGDSLFTAVAALSAAQTRLKALYGMRLIVVPRFVTVDTTDDMGWQSVFLRFHVRVWTSTVREHLVMM